MMPGNLPPAENAASRAPRRRSMAARVMLWLASVLIAVSAAWAFLGTALSSREIRRGLGQHAQSYAGSLADVLQHHVWNMDASRLAAFFAQHPPQPEFLGIEVIDQFGQPIHWVSYGCVSGGFRVSAPVVREAEVIGHVQVWASLESLKQTRKLLFAMSFWQALGQVLLLMGLGFVIIQFFIRRPTACLIQQVRKVAAGDYDFRFPESRYSELADFQKKVARLAESVSERTSQLKREIEDKEQARVSLAQLSEQLEDRVRTRTIELERSNAELNRLLRERARIQRELVDAGAREQRHIGQLLHDSLGQQLAGLSFMAAALFNRAAKGDPATAKEAERIAELSREALDITRKLAHGLSPVDTGDRGLEVSLERLAKDSAMMFGLACFFESRVDGEVPDESVATQLYYIAQEAISNAARHASASQVRMILDCGQTGGKLVIEDNGRGMNLDHVERGTGMGMRTMRYRSELIGGTFEVDTAPGRGTRLTIMFCNHLASDASPVG